MKIGIVTPVGWRLNIEADPEILCSEITEHLIETGLLAPGTYMVVSVCSNRTLEPHRSLSDNGIGENDTLQILHGTSA